ncbi:MAG: hypothetical protein WCS37_21355 [Chloroflexota bacterium]|nr:hypothetical protein [Chloroflexota bacterium]
MSRRYNHYLSLVVVLLLGLAISLIPANPVLGSPQPSGIQVQQSITLQNPVSNSLVRYSHTLFVSSNGTPTGNGTSLLAAMTIISNSNPTAATPYLLKLEPGQYDLGNQALTLLSYVDLEGSGEDITVISSTIGSSTVPPSGTLIVPSYSETRFLKVANSGSSAYQTAIFLPANAINARFTHVTASASGGTNSYGLYNYFGTFTVQESTFSASGGTNSSGLYNNLGIFTVQNSTFSASGGTNSFGLYNTSGTATVQNSTFSASTGITNTGFYNYNLATAVVQNSTFSASGGTNSFGFQNDGTSTVRNSTLTASGGSFNLGFYNNLGTSTVQNSTLSASASGVATSSNEGLSNYSTLTVQNSTLTASGGSTSYGLYNSSGSASTVQNSTLSASGGTTNYALNNTAGTIKVGASQLASLPISSNTGLGASICINSYNANFTALNSSCL